HKIIIDLVYAYIYFLLMFSTTAFFDAFGSLLFGRAPRTARAQFKSQLPRADSISALREAFGSLVPDPLLCPQPKGRASRQRLFSPLMTFWAFLSQVLSPNSAPAATRCVKPKLGGRCDTKSKFLRLPVLIVRLGHGSQIPSWSASTGMCAIAWRPTSQALVSGGGTPLRWSMARGSPCPTLPATKPLTHNLCPRSPAVVFPS